MLTLLQRLAERRPQQDAVHSEHSESTLQGLCRVSESIASLFGKSEHPLIVYIALPGGMEFTALQFAAIASGAIAVPMPPKATASEASRFFQILKPDILCVSSMQAGRLLVSALPSMCAVIVLKPGDSPVCGHTPLRGRPY